MKPLIWLIHLVGKLIFCQGSIHVLIFILVLHPLDLFPDWYVLNSWFSSKSDLLANGKMVFGPFLGQVLSYFIVQVQSLPRMIILDEIGKQVLLYLVWKFFQRFSFLGLLVYLCSILLLIS